MAVSESVQILRDTYAWKKTDRIPTFSNYWTYIVLEAGEKLSKALYDYDVLYDCVTKFHEKYHFDSYNYIGIRNPFRVVEALGCDHYIIDDEREAFNVKDRYNMNGDEYDELIADPVKFLWEKAVPRVCPLIMAPDADVHIAKAVKENEAYNAFSSKVTKKFLGDYGATIRAYSNLGTGSNFLFNTLRGIKGFSLDMRRDINKVVAACDAMMDTFLEGDAIINKCTKDLPDTYAAGISTTFLSHSVMNHKQFGIVEWPIVKKMIDRCIETGNVANIFSESEFLRFADYFQDLPKGVLTVQPEEDDMFDLRKALPNVCLNGGMPSTLLGTGTKEECLDFAKKLVDEVGRDGGFVMGQNKMMTYRNDAKPENIAAVQEFCRTYKG